MCDFSSHYTDAKKIFDGVSPLNNCLILPYRLFTIPIGPKTRQILARLRISEPRFECRLRNPGGIAICVRCVCHNCIQYLSGTPCMFKSYAIKEHIARARQIIERVIGTTQVKWRLEQLKEKEQQQKRMFCLLRNVLLLLLFCTIGLRIIWNNVSARVKLYLIVGEAQKLNSNPFCV